jgi:hypothetical protein
MKPLRTMLNIVFAVVVFIAVGNGQWKNATAAMMGKSGGSIPVGFGATFIDGEAFYLINITPEVAFGNLGVGLDLNLRINTKGKLRPGDYSKFEDYLRIIRYVRWAQKGDPFYTRVGLLDYSLLGHGSIVYNYRNSASYDMRRTGIELDLNFEKFGFESMYSNIADRGLLGMRGYVKPLKFTSFEKIPVINNFEVGATYARDLSKVADITSTDSSRRGLTIIGFDLGLPILSYTVLKSALYFDYTQIVHYGHGTSVGINMNFSGLGLVDLRGKYELRFNGVHYLPAYFDALYEHDRFDPVRRLSKSDMLDTVGANRGYYGELIISILNTFNIIAGYQAPFDIKNQGLLHAELQLPEVSGIVIRGAFDKTNIGRVFILDNYSILSAEIGYKPVKYILVSTLYQQTYSNRNPDGSLRSDGSFIKQNRVEPKVSLVFDF